MDLTTNRQRLSAAPEGSGSTPPEEGGQQTATQQQTGQQQQQKLAGRFDTYEQFANEFHNVSKQIGQVFPSDKPLYGEGGIFTSRELAESAYKGMQRIRDRRPGNQQPQTQDSPNNQQAQQTGQQQTQQTDGEGLQIGPAELPPGDQINAEQLLQAAGLDPQEVVESYQANGQLDPQKTQLLQDAVQKAIDQNNGKLPVGLIDSFLQGNVAQAQLHQQTQQQIRQQAADMAGGERQLQTLLSTARTFVPADEIEDINARLQNPKSFKGAMRDIMHYHQQAVQSGNARQLQEGQAAGRSGNVILGRDEYIRTSRAARRGDTEAQQRLKAHAAAGGPRHT